MIEKIHKDMYYKLTEEDKEQITMYFNESKLGKLIEFCQAVAQVASYNTWSNAELYLKDVGPKKFFRSCVNCGHMFDCIPDFALNECGDRYEKWIPLTERQADRLKKLKMKVKGELK